MPLVFLSTTRQSARGPWIVRLFGTPSSYAKAAPTFFPKEQPAGNGTSSARADLSGRCVVGCSTAQNCRVCVGGAGIDARCPCHCNILLFSRQQQQQQQLFDGLNRLLVHTAYFASWCFFLPCFFALLASRASLFSSLPLFLLGYCSCVFAIEQFFIYVKKKIRGAREEASLRARLPLVSVLIRVAFYRSVTLMGLTV